MSQTAITLAFEQWKASQSVTGEPVLLDEFVFASVPGLDATKPIDRNETLPPDAQIVHRQAVSRKGVVNENAVVHSVVLGADVGDFSFNWIGLINKASNTLAMIVHAPLQQKLKTKDGQQGNVLTRSFLMEFNGAQTETGINTPAETWQIDFTARMAGMDERQRLENTDIYGAAAFFGDGYLVGKNGSQYFVTPGVGYVRGLRTQLVASRNIVVTNKPVKVWLDVAWTGTLTSAWAVESKITVAEALGDYVRDGVQHFVFAVASIDANGNITDLRPKGTLVDQAASDALKKHELSRNHPDATTYAKGFTQLSSATDSDSEILAATPKAVKTVSDEVTKLKKSLGTAATKDVQESRDDTTAGRVLVNGGALAVRSVAASADRDVKDASGLPANSVSFCYASAANSPGYEATILDVGGLRQDYRVQYAASYADGGKRLKFRTLNGDNGYWGSWTTVLTNYGGNVDYLDGAKYFAAKAEYWQGAGGFAHQYSNGTAPIFVRGFTSPAGVSNYFPLVKGSTVISGQGWGSAVSFGILRNGNNDFGSAVIHIIGDSGSGAMYGFDANGNFNSQGEVRAGTNIVASQGVYESGGAVRVYSSNNPPPLGAYATIDWIMHNFITDVALGAEGSFLIAKNAWQRAPAGCVLTGYNAEGNEPVNDTLFYRPIQKHIPSYGWINVGHTA
ncbi:phage tail-collar fiber domain-containing protein [Enterobacter roggenkampii]